MRKITFTLLVLIGYFVNAQEPIEKNNQIIQHNGFVLSYNETCEQPNWVHYKLTKNDLLENDTVKRKNYFKRDPLVVTESASGSDYSRPYDRGHLKPASDESNNQEQMNETFYMSNISPQDYSFNRGVWKRLESRVRSYVNEGKADSIFVTTGPILHDSLPRIGKENKVCVPQYFWKVLKMYKGGEFEYEVYYMKNEKSYEALNRFRIELEVLENKTNLIFNQ
jgi:endonuclease G